MPPGPSKCVRARRVFYYSRMAEQLGTTERERQLLEQERRTIHARRLLAVVPIALVVIFTTLWAIPATRDIATGRSEANPVELLTFVFMVAAAVMAWRLGARLWRLGHPLWISALFLLLGTGALIVALDEIAWGQVFVNMFKDGINATGNEPAAIDFTGLRSRTELFRFGFAVVGILGVYLDRWKSFRNLAVPAALLPWLVVIGVVSGFDVIGDIVRFGGTLQDFFVRSSELIEMMIAMVAVLYVNFKMRELWWRIP